MNRFVYSEGRVRARARVCGALAPAAAPPTPLARAHSSTPQGFSPHPPGPPYSSWDHMFLCNGFCCSPPLSSCFFFADEVHATVGLFHLLLRYHLILITQRLD